MGIEVLSTGGQPKRPTNLGPVVNAPVRISQVFGDRPDYYAQFHTAGHPGLDLVAAKGTIIMAAHAGKVLERMDNGDGYGKRIVIWSEELCLKTLYAHLDIMTVTKGHNCYEGEEIGHLGETGNVTGAHLHFGVMRTKDAKSAGDLFGEPFVANSEPLHSDNGFLGWEDPQDDSLFNWYKGYGYGEVAVEGEQPGAVPTPTIVPLGESATSPWPVTFETAFPIIYPGWDKPSAKADFALYGEKKWNEYLASLVKKKEKARPAALQKIYILNPAYGNLSLKQISEGGIPLGRVDILAGFLGIPEDQKLQPGQELSMSGFPTDYYPSSSEWQAVLRLTAKGAVGKVGDYYIKPEYAGLNLHQIQDKGVAVGRPDILAGFLGISDTMPIPGNQGFGTQGFPNIYDTGSGEVQGFFNLFTKTPPVPAETAVETITPPAEEIPIVPAVPKYPTISVTSTPTKAKFYIDGIYYSDLTPSNKAYPVDVGTHIVRVEKAGYQTKEISFSVAESEQKIVDVELTLGPSEVLPEVPESALGTAYAVEALARRIDKIEEALTRKGIMD